jgi:hypothetical protein
MFASMLATLSAAAPHPSSNDNAVWVILVCMIVIPIECFMIGFPVVEFWRGERPFGLRPGRVTAVTKGNVVLCGTVEPAWSVLTSPFSRKVCVWYRAESGWNANTARSRTHVTVFNETNAIPFVLNDGTGRILVLGRRARWDSETSGQTAGASTGIARQPRTGPHRPPPPPILTWSMDGITRDSIDSAGTDKTIPVGAIVTVVGRAIPCRPSAITPQDACLDEGRSLDLSGEFLIGPRSLAVGLDVLAGTPSQIRRNARVGIAIGVAGSASLAATIYFVLTATAS